MGEAVQAQDVVLEGMVVHPDGSYDRHPIPTLPPDGVVSKDVTLDESTNLWVRVFLPRQDASSKLPLIVFFHGGGFMIMSADSVVYHQLCTSLSEVCRAVVVSVNYRLAPEHRLPAAYDDALTVMEWIQGVAPEVLGSQADLGNVFVIGDSAGGNLTHQVTMRVTHKETGLKGVKLAGQVLIQPFFGGEERCPSEVGSMKPDDLSLLACDVFWKYSLPEGSDRDHPFCNVKAALAGSGLGDVELPKTLVAIGGEDLLRDRDYEYVELVSKSGVHVETAVYESAGHAFYMDPGCSDTSKLLERIAEFVNNKNL